MMKIILITLITLIFDSAIAQSSFEVYQNLHLSSVPKKNKKIKVMIIDTEIDSSHPLISPFFNRTFMSSPFYGQGSKIEYAHGTHVSGILAQGLKSVFSNAAEMVEFIPCNFYRFDNKELFHQNNCLEEAIQKKVDLINFSGGGFNGFSHDFVEMFREENLMRKLQEQGIILVASAGNNASDREDYLPCNYKQDNVFCVANIERDKSLFHNSNFTTNVRFVATGVNILSSEPHGNYGFMSGTSQSTPKVSVLLIAKLLGLNDNRLKRIMRDFEIYEVVPRSSSIGGKNQLKDLCLSLQRTIASFCE